MRDLQRRHWIWMGIVALMTTLAVVGVLRRQQVPRWTVLPFIGICVGAAVRLPRHREQRAPSARGQVLVQALKTALAREGISDKQAAAMKDMKPTQHSAEMNLRGYRSPSLERMGAYPDEVLVSFIEEVAEWLNAHVTVIRNKRLAQLIQKVEALPAVSSVPLL